MWYLNIAENQELKLPNDFFYLFWIEFYGDLGNSSVALCDFGYCLFPTKNSVYVQYIFDSRLVVQVAVPWGLNWARC